MKKCISMTGSQFENYNMFPEDELQWEKIQQHVYKKTRFNKKYESLWMKNILKHI